MADEADLSRAAAGARAAARARAAGAVLQGLVLGFLVVLAGMELASLAGALSPFKYQGF
jgi:hypothetical protein